MANSIIVFAHYMNFLNLLRAGLKLMEGRIKLGSREFPTYGLRKSSKYKSTKMCVYLNIITSAISYTDLCPEYLDSTLWF